MSIFRSLSIRKGKKWMEPPRSCVPYFGFLSAHFGFQSSKCDLKVHLPCVEIYYSSAHSRESPAGLKKTPRNSQDTNSLISRLCDSGKPICSTLHSGNEFYRQNCAPKTYEIAATRRYEPCRFRALKVPLSGPYLATADSIEGIMSLSDCLLTENSVLYTRKH